MSWFDKLFGESSDKDTHHTHETFDEDDVYRRPRGKFRFPLNIEHIKSEEDFNNDVYVQYEETNHHHEPKVRETFIDQRSENDGFNEGLRTSFNSDYVPRRDRRSSRHSISKDTSNTNPSPKNYERYQPQTRFNDTPTYRSYQTKSNHKTSYQSNQSSSTKQTDTSKKTHESFSEKQYKVHQPKFKASVVPSAIYGTKPRKDPTTLKQPVNPVQSIQGKKSESVRPVTPTHRKEDNTVNIENVYASQIVAEIRREREKKLQRKKQFELEREQLKLQQEEISSMMHEENNDVEYVHVENDQNTQDIDSRVTIIDDNILHESVDELKEETDQYETYELNSTENPQFTQDITNAPKDVQEGRLRIIGEAVKSQGPVITRINIGNEDKVKSTNPQEVNTSTFTDINSSESIEVIQIDESESFVYSTKTPFKAEMEANVENKAIEQTKHDELFLDENVTFDQPDEEIIEVEKDAIDQYVDFNEDFIAEEHLEVNETYEGNIKTTKSLEPTLLPDMKSSTVVEAPSSEVKNIEPMEEVSIEPDFPPIVEDDEIVSTSIIESHESDDVVSNIHDLSSTQDNQELENQDITLDHQDLQTQDAITHEPQPAPKANKKVSPFNVLMTPSDKRRLLDKQRQVTKTDFTEVETENVASTSEIKETTESMQAEESITDDIQRSFEQQGSSDNALGHEIDPVESIIEIEDNTSEESIDIEPVNEISEVEEVQKSDKTPQVTRDLQSQNSQNIVSNNGYPVKKEPAKRIGPKYLLPPVSLLHPEDRLERDETWVEEHQSQLDDAFYHFNVPAKVENVVVGPSVTRFELSVEKGVKVSRITNLQDDIKMALAAKDIRIEAPIPGTSLVGVEVPNVETRNVNLSEVLFSKKMKFAESKLTVALGARINNEPMIMDLAKMPHGLIAGATGSGKSVCINSILVSLLYRNNPNELKLLLIDPKMVELAPYNDLPHLIAPVITDVKAATESLKWVVEEMERRYKIFADIHVRNITAYNQKVSYVERLPKIVIVIDELADLMMMSPQDVEHAIARIAQKARAAGIHMILATQRPSVNVITGLIKANVPTRVAFMVSSAVDSRTIIDSGGAEKLLGNGDMLYLGNGMNKPIRIQGNYVSDEEIDAVVQYVKTQGEPNYLFQEKELLKKVSEAPKDELFNEICDFMIDEGHISTSQIQRRFQIGYNRAARIIDQLEDIGYVSGQNGSKPRAVLITEKQEEY